MICKQDKRKTKDKTMGDNVYRGGTNLKKKKKGRNFGTTLEYLAHPSVLWLG